MLDDGEAWGEEEEGAEAAGAAAEEEVWHEWSGVSALDPQAILEEAPRMEAMRARIEADHPEPKGRATYLRASTV